MSMSTLMERKTALSTEKDKAVRMDVWKWEGTLME